MNQKHHDMPNQNESKLRDMPNQNEYMKLPQCLTSGTVSDKQSVWDQFPSTGQRAYSKIYLMPKNHTIQQASLIK